MKNFIIKLVLFFSVITLIHIFFAFLADGSTNDYYGKFASPKQNSLVIGTSRALQAVMPHIVDSVLKPQNNKMYNYAFTVSSSPFGEVYYNAIKGKLNKNSENSIFIVAVDPWALSLDTSLLSLENPDKNTLLSNMENFNGHPNFEYLFKKYPKGWGNIILKRIEYYLLQQKDTKDIKGSWTYLNDNGWLDVNASMDSSFVKNKVINKVKSYTSLMEKREFSNYRFNYLIKTIDFLQEHGKVYLVRLPVHPDLLVIENNFTPNFDHNIKKAINISHDYYDMSNQGITFHFTDGNHLHKSSGRIVSKLIAERIRDKRL